MGAGVKAKNVTIQMHFIIRVSGCKVQGRNLSRYTNEGLPVGYLLADDAHGPVLYIFKEYKTVNYHMQAGLEQTGLEITVF